METLKGLSNVVQDESEKNTLMQCFRLLQRPHYKLIKLEQTIKEKFKHDTDLFTKTIVKKSKKNSTQTYQWKS